MKRVVKRGRGAEGKVGKAVGEASLRIRLYALSLAPWKGPTSASFTRHKRRKKRGRGAGP